jgi:hypothetical protein
MFIPNAVVKSIQFNITISTIVIRDHDRDKES